MLPRNWHSGELIKTEMEFHRTTNWQSNGIEKQQSWETPQHRTI